MQTGLTLSVTRDADAIRAAQRLRHRVFVEEMGADPGDRAGLETDPHDGQSDHLILRDAARPDLGVVATVRVRGGTHYTEREFDLSVLTASGRTIAEAGRACLHAEYRGGLAAMVLFKGLGVHLQQRGVDIAVGTASFPGARIDAHLPALRRLQAEALAPADLRPVARGSGAVAISGSAPKSAMIGVPALIKTYLRAGAFVGAGAYVDRAFNTVDVCMVLDMERLRLPERAG
ncbi:GNAT family N-acetyltransferase [Jannaschia donghaensis]|uniref:L-ornithine N(alpha)-acyltransferase n=1 Tax=Jannaschia donghaensis TaxID=420998 RepID=A0A0M6YLD9_9RHOB|nr:GNAT family N-acetyltransferase [Jannaschia donghaensis]CTQ50475.1 N-acyl amino acid synthase, PEP-CTERM/exosortase system-associated [Jannaschia donghaensis]